jgi:hypothetical protein
MAIYGTIYMYGHYGTISIICSQLVFEWTSDISSSFIFLALFDLIHMLLSVIMIINVL